MKKPVLLLQFRTDQTLEHERKCILEKGGFTNGELKIVNVLDKRYKLPKPKDLDKYRAVITGASSEFDVTKLPKNVEERINKILPLLKEIVKRDFPTLAICFGHQLFAQLLSGIVESDDTQEEVGTHKITLTNYGKKSKLFKGIPPTFYVVEGHKDSVTKMPKGAKLLAYSNKCLVQACQLGNNIYSIQFHPELSLDDLIWRLSLHPQYLKGQTAEDVRRKFSEIPYAGKIVKNFNNMINGNDDG